jgi:hypothetical protein
MIGSHMKKNYSIISVMLLLFFCSFSFAQNSSTNTQAELQQQRTSKQHKNALKSSAFIFEGIATTQEVYKSKRGEEWTCTIFQITKIFKGSSQIKLGSIKIITKQGNCLKDGGPAIGKERRYVIITNPADASTLNDKMPVTDNAPTLYGGYVIAILEDVKKSGTTKNITHQFHAEWIGTQGDRGTVFKTLDELYSYFKENGLTVEEDVKQPDPTKLPADTTKH